MNVIEKAKKAPKVMLVRYVDHDNHINLTTYADTIVFDRTPQKDLLAAIRFGGYPEQVRAMSDAIYGGGTVYAEIGEERLTLGSAVKQYRRELSHDGNYAIATLLIDNDKLEADENDEKGTQENEKNQPRINYLFCERDNDDQLFEQVDRKVSVPLITDFCNYLIPELQNQKALKRLTVISSREKFDAWKLMVSSGEKNIIKIINSGLTKGIISIPGSNAGDANAFGEINSVSQYLNAYGVTIAARNVDNSIHCLILQLKAYHRSC